MNKMIDFIEAWNNITDQISQYHKESNTSAESEKIFEKVIGIINSNLAKVNVIAPIKIINTNSIDCKELKNAMSSASLTVLPKEEDSVKIVDVANIIAELFGGDTCACNYNDIDEFLPKHCKYANTTCPDPGDTKCWEEYIRNRLKKGGLS